MPGSTAPSTGPVRKSPGGSWEKVNAQKGNPVRTGDIIARLDDAALPPGANLELALIRAPVNGIILKKLGSSGEVLGPGQPVALLVDPASFYVTANVEETKISRVKPGQKVDLTVGAFPDAKFAGRVVAIEKATAATFSLLPQRSAAGKFTKVVQYVPVKISFTEPLKRDLTYGTSVVARVHLR
ncbi:MAG: HlyD family secretion protein [Moorella sp. (in: Bacteria)]|nr:HlyD family secretion protein [Moorella sp. (in: firmicutes)]